MITWKEAKGFYRIAEDLYTRLRDCGYIVTSLPAGVSDEYAKANKFEGQDDYPFSVIVQVIRTEEMKYYETTNKGPYPIGVYRQDSDTTSDALLWLANLTAKLVGKPNNIEELQSNLQFKKLGVAMTNLGWMLLTNSVYDEIHVQPNGYSVEFPKKNTWQIIKAREIEQIKQELLSIFQSLEVNSEVLNLAFKVAGI